jgi:hypothetical protein
VEHVVTIDERVLVLVTELRPQLGVGGWMVPLTLHQDLDYLELPLGVAGKKTVEVYLTNALLSSDPFRWGDGWDESGDAIHGARVDVELHVHQCLHNLRANVVVVRVAHDGPPESSAPNFAAASACMPGITWA